MIAQPLPVELQGGRFTIRTHDVGKRFGSTDALKSVNVTVPEGSIYLLVGPNGAGKTTLLRMVQDLVRPTEGRVEVFGASPAAEGPAIRARIGFVPERHAWGYGWMRVDRLLRHHALFYPSWDWAYAERLTRTFGLRLDRRMSRLSKGEARRVQLLLALAHRPSLLLLDEPTDGLDPVMRDETLGLLAEHLAETPTTGVISTHLVHEAEGLADHIGVLHGGHLRAQLELSALRAGLRRYRAETPEGWEGAPGLNGTVLRKRQTGRELQWTVWGEEKDVVEHLKGSGAVVRESSSITLEEATLALLSRKE